MLAQNTLVTKIKSLKLLSLYEQRHNRTLQTTMKQLEEMQAERKEREQKEMEEANQIDKLFKMKGEVYNPADDGFGFSPKKFVIYQSREQHREEAKIAYGVGYNLKKFQAEIANRANA